MLKWRLQHTGAITTWLRRLRLALARRCLQLLGYDVFDLCALSGGSRSRGVPDAGEVRSSTPPSFYLAPFSMSSAPDDPFAVYEVLTPFAALLNLPPYPDEDGVRAVWHNLRAALTLLASHQVNDAWLHDPYLMQDVGYLVARTAIHVSAYVDEYLQALVGERTSDADISTLS